MSLNRDFFVAVIILALCAVMYIATFQLPEPMFGQISSAAWPRLILVPLAALCVILLVQSQLGDRDEEGLGTSFGGWLAHNRNPFFCFLLFFLFLLTMPVLGMLIGGLLYVFLTLGVLGGWRPRQLLLHAAISAVFVIGMWVIFTQLLGVLLPEGTILRVY